jgi:prepilin-type N-terminal cleavage/methylation domain-containing protein
MMTKTKGFTLIELMVVITIVGILAAVVLLPLVGSGCSPDTIQVY